MFSPEKNMMVLKYLKGCLTEDGAGMFFTVSVTGLEPVGGSCKKEGFNLTLGETSSH